MEDYERAAGGLDFDEESGEKNFGEALLQGGPDALLEQIEGMLPDQWREHIVRFPLTALALGFGAGLFLGMRKGDDVISAGSAMLSAAATAQMTQILADLGND